MMSATVPVLALPESGARPHVHGLRIARTHRRRTQRASQPVDLRISERRLGLMLVNEPVAQPACVATGKRPRDNGFSELRILQRSTVDGAATRFVREQERGSELGRDRARRQDAPHIVCGHQPTSSHDWHVDGRFDLGQQFVEGLGGRLRARVERAAMPAGRRALYSYSVDAAGDRGLRLGQRGHGADDRDARLAQPSALLGARHAEGERRDGRPHVEQHLDLGRPVVVVEPRLTELGAVALGLRRERLGVELDVPRGARTRLWHKQIRADRAGSQAARRGEPLGEHLGSQVTRSDEAEPACIRPGGRKCRRRRSTGHRRDEDRHRQIAKVERHRSFVSRRADSLTTGCSPKATATSGSWAAGAVSSPRCSDFAGVAEGDRVLDVGSGTGALPRPPRPASLPADGYRAGGTVCALAQARIPAIESASRSATRNRCDSPTTPSIARCRCWC